MALVSPPQTEINSVLALYSNGQIQEALGAVETLIKSYPNNSLLFNISGVCYKAIGKLDEAVKSFEKAIAIKPDYAEVHYNIGVTLRQLGQHYAAVKSYEKALTIKPDYANASNNLGNILKDLGQLNAAVKSFEKAIAIKPDYAEAHNNLGVTFQKLGQQDAAAKHYEKALVIKPDYADAHNNLGNVLKDHGQLNAAVKSFEKAIAIKPDFADAYYNLGNTLNDLGQLDTAVISFEKTLTIKPDFAEVHNNLGNVLRELGQLDASIKSFEKTLAIKPDYAEAHNNLGLTLVELGRRNAAVKSYEKAITIKPDFPEAYRNLGSVMLGFKRMDEAMTNFERALFLNPKLDFLLGHTLHTKMHLCLWDDLSSRLEELQDKINNNEKVIPPFPMLGLIDDPELQRKVTEIFVNKHHPKNHDLPKIGLYPKHKKIRIGYFSADFKEHPVAALTAELYEIHDRNHFEIHAFSYGPDTKDKMNLRIKAGVDHFYDVRTMSHKDVAMLARSLEIDIALDLGGYTHHARTGIFALRAAPIQVNYLGYAGTMGADFIDYLIADHTLISEEKQHHYSEKIAYLPNSFMVNDTKNNLSNRLFTRAEVGLPTNGFVFCCFNNHYKITPSTFIRWMKILSKVDGSVLWLAKDNSSSVKNLKKEAKKNGVDENRIIFASRLTLREDHLNRIQLADLFIDTLPYNAHATTSDALQVGLPVLTCIGNSFASRVAASLINSVNLPELITNTQEQYESLAIELATDPKKLKTIKKKLNNNLPESPIYDTPLYTQHLESAYSMMYDRYQRGLDPDHIYVKHKKQ